MNIEFPQYRKLLNERSYYKITSSSEMLEIQKTGSNWTEHRLTAKILPERILIQDLLSGHEGRYLIITATEFDAFRELCGLTLKRF